MGSDDGGHDGLDPRLEHFTMATRFDGEHSMMDMRENDVGKREDQEQHMQQTWPATTKRIMIVRVERGLPTWVFRVYV